MSLICVPRSCIQEVPPWLYTLTAFNSSVCDRSHGTRWAVNPLHRSTNSIYLASIINKWLGSLLLRPSPSGIFNLRGRLAHLARAQHWRCWGDRFESYIAHQNRIFGGIAAHWGGFFFSEHHPLYLGVEVYIISNSRQELTQAAQFI